MDHKRVWMLVGSPDLVTEVAPVLEVTTNINLALAKVFDFKDDGDMRIVEIWLDARSEAGHLARGLEVMETLFRLIEGHVDDNLLTLATQEVDEMREILADALQGVV